MGNFDNDSYAASDRTIHTDDAYDVQLWALVLGVSEQSVVDAVARVGTDAVDVQHHLAHERDAQPPR